MCDTLYLHRPEAAVFAKNSDRPSAEPQLVAAHPPRSPGGRLRTQYLELEDRGACAVVVSSPTWLWGAEHGVNEHGVAIGNEKVYALAEPHADGGAPRLIGMDLVRLGLELGQTAAEAVAVMTELIETYGQAGVCDRTTGESYSSSFLVADAAEAFVVETAGRRWAAARAPGAAAISNRLTLRDDWTAASSELAPGDDFDRYRDPGAPTGDADARLAASRAFLRRAGDEGGGELAAATVAHLRDHGRGAWGRPGAAGPPSPVAAELSPEGKGTTICMHVPGTTATTGALVARLDAARDGARVAYVALGSPCVSVFVPVRLGRPLPAVLGDRTAWQALAELRSVVEATPAALATVRGALDPVEAQLWAAAAEPGGAPAPADADAAVRAGIAEAERAVVQTWPGARAR